MSRDEIIALIYRIADEYGLPRLLLLGCCIAESNLNPNARRPVSAQQDAAFWPDVSGGLGQQTVLYDPAYRGGNEYPGAEETQRVLALQFNPERAVHVAAANLRGRWNGDPSDAGLLRAMYLYNWPNGGGQPYTEGHRANYQRGLREARKIMVNAPARIIYNSQEPAIAQNDAWSCAPTSTRWAMKSLGRTQAAESWFESQMQADGVVSQALGLLDASGGRLAAWLREQYGEFGYTASNDPNVSFDDVSAEAGRYPLLIGGRAWNHWSGVRGFGAGQGLLLANPSHGHHGVGSTMSREQFSALGPFSLVRITHPDLAVQPPPPPRPDPRDAEIAHLKHLLADANSRLGVASVDYVKGLRDLADAYEALKP